VSNVRDEVNLNARRATQGKYEEEAIITGIELFVDGGMTHI
jgi:hypothetical protein